MVETYVMIFNMLLGNKNFINKQIVKARKFT